MFQQISSWDFVSRYRVHVDRLTLTSIRRLKRAVKIKRKSCKIDRLAAGSRCDRSHNKSKQLKTRDRKKRFFVKSFSIQRLITFNLVKLIDRHPTCARNLDVHMKLKTEFKFHRILKASMIDKRMSSFLGLLRDCFVVCCDRLNRLNIPSSTDEYSRWKCVYQKTSPLPCRLLFVSSNFGLVTARTLMRFSLRFLRVKVDTSVKIKRLFLAILYAILLDTVNENWVSRRNRLLLPV